MSASIMCTMTSAQVTADSRWLFALTRAGMSSIRLNTAHLNGVDELRRLAKAIKDFDPNLKVMIDTKGPEVRTSATRDDKPVTLSPGEMVCVVAGDEPTADGTIRVNFDELHRHVKPGSTLLIDDAHIKLSVSRIVNDEIIAKVVNGGELGSHKGVAVEGVDLPLPAVSERDRMFIEFAAHSPIIDLIAHSFVRSADDIRAVRSAMGNASKPIIAKIENQQGIDNLLDIIEHADGGILIARGDLGASLGKQRLPEAQRIIAEATKRAGKPLILATAILPSMMRSLVPSEADLEGIHTALDQGVDTMLLTNESAHGQHPVQTVAQLAESIARHSSAHLVKPVKSAPQPIDIDERLERYILDHIDPEPENLRRLNRCAQVSLLYGHMCSGHLQGRILKMITRMIRPKRVLELGAYVGYSALCIAQGLDDDGEVYSVEINDEMESFIRRQLDLDPAGARVHLHIGDARDIVPTIEGMFDMVLIDANKREYIDNYEMVLPRVRPGGFILADNTLWAGKVAELDANRDPLTRGVALFNDHVAADPRVERVILPIRDGLTIIRKI